MAKRIQILILEDSPADAEAMVLRLKEDGFEPDWHRVTTPGELMARLTPSVDVILADYHLPGFTAADLLRVLRDTNNPVPVIIVSGMLGDEAAVDLLQDGASDYVLKDRMARLGPAVERAMSDRAARLLRDELNARLAENERLLRSILDSVEDVVWSMKLPSRELVFVNKAVLALLARDPDEILHNPAIWRDVVHPEDRGIYDASYQQALRWGFTEAEYRVVRKDGATRWVRSRLWIAFKDGQASRAEGILSDITRQREAASGSDLTLKPVPPSDSPPSERSASETVPTPKPPRDPR